MRSRSYSQATMTPRKGSRSYLAHSTIEREASTQKGTPSNKHTQNNNTSGGEDQDSPPPDKGDDPLDPVADMRGGLNSQ